jgi:hypothetical protein
MVGKSWEKWVKWRRQWGKVVPFEGKNRMKWQCIDMEIAKMDVFLP